VDAIRGVAAAMVGGEVLVTDGIEEVAVADNGVAAGIYYKCSR
jgi:hypothetical protein